MENDPTDKKRVVINGQRFFRTNAVMYLLTLEVVRELEAKDDIDWDEMRDTREEADPQRLEQQVKFGPIKAIVEALTQKTDYESAISWLVTPTTTLRPLDVVNTDEWPKLLAYIKSDAFTVFA
jgi:hypothetical protein